MTIDKDKLKALIAECRYGVSGKGPAIEVANDLLVNCCDNLESLLAEIDQLKAEIKALSEGDFRRRLRVKHIPSHAQVVQRDGTDPYAYDK